MPRDSEVRRAVLPLLCVLLVWGGWAERGERGSPDRQTQRTKETGRESTTQPSFNSLDTAPPESRFVDPKITWLFFKNNSNKGVNGRKGNRHRVQNQQHGQLGPPGPPGPPGPSGLPRPALPTEELLEEFRALLKEAAAHWGDREPSVRCPLCGGQGDEPLGGTDRQPSLAGPYHHVQTAFHCQLKDNSMVRRRSLLELSDFTFQPAGGDSLIQRGQDFNISSGRYTAPVSGFYQLTANLLIEHREYHRKLQPRLGDCIQVSICIQSLCQHNMSLETKAGGGSAGSLFTVLATGTLYLQVGQHVSVFVDNGTGSALFIQKGSSFSGILLGV